jgi:hypothetical protein
VLVAKKKKKKEEKMGEQPKAERRTHLTKNNERVQEKNIKKQTQ